MYYNFGRQGKNLLLSIQSFSSVNLVSYINLCLTHFLYTIINVQMKEFQM